MVCKHASHQHLFVIYLICVTDEMRYGFKHCPEEFIHPLGKLHTGQKGGKRPMKCIDLYNSCMFLLSLAVVLLLILQDERLDPVRGKQVNQMDLIGVDLCTSRSDDSLFPWHCVSHHCSRKQN